jgi:L-methionine (R)-S-oxide reductase|tara:strand:- start:189 stop:644 length:456 start_codon:yes stop_codon:yes gene_type:complete
MKLQSEIVGQVRALIAEEENLVANLANTTALLMSATSWHWVGFYLLDRKKNELVLGPFQGPVACTRLQKGRGVCAKSWELSETIVINDVESFEGHIACSSLSKSEVVIPVVLEGEVVGVLDIDSVELNGFTPSDVKILEDIVQIIAEQWLG